MWGRFSFQLQASLLVCLFSQLTWAEGTAPSLGERCDQLGEYIAYEGSKLYSNLPDINLGFNEHSLRAAADKVLDHVPMGSTELDLIPWHFLNSPHQEVRKTSLQVQFNLIAAMVSKKIEKPKRISHSEILELLDSLPASQWRDRESFFTADLGPYVDYKGVQASSTSLFSSVLCSLLNINRCADAFQDILKSVNPTHFFRKSPRGTEWRDSYTVKLPFTQNSQAVISLLDLLEQRFKDPMFFNTLKHASKRVLDKIHFAENGWQVQGHIFEDLVVAASQAGVKSKHGQRQMAWEVLGIYATRGASWSILTNAMNSKVYPSLAAMMVFSAGISYLDIFKHTEGDRTYYSLPKNIKAPCSYGKPYHFWMAAYLSHDLSNQKGYDWKTSFYSTYLASVAYGFAAETSGRFRNDFINETLDSFTVTSKRLSLMYQSAGAAFLELRLNRRSSSISRDSLKRVNYRL